MSGYGAGLRIEEEYVRATQRLGLETTIVKCAESSFGGRAAAADVLRVRPDVTAIMIMKDNAASGLVAGLEAAGRAVPSDVSVLSLMSSSEMAASSNPILSSLNAPSEELGRLSIEALIDQLEGRSTELPHALLPCVLHVADSTAPVRADASGAAAAAMA
jgi:DNA-binding LacI/PurR family transcriptional regulator